MVRKAGGCQVQQNLAERQARFFLKARPRNAPVRVIGKQAIEGGGVETPVA